MRALSDMSGGGPPLVCRCAANAKSVALWDDPNAIPATDQCFLWNAHGGFERQIVNFKKTNVIFYWVFSQIESFAFGDRDFPVGIGHKSVRELDLRRDPFSS
jgi:hypothetical protein